MKRLLVVWVVMIGVIATGLPATAQQSNECAAGENTDQGPPPPPSSDPAAECEASPTSTQAGPTQPEIEESEDNPSEMGPAAVTPINRFWLGIEENGDFPVQGTGGTLNVVDPSVSHSTGPQFLSQRVRVAACSTGQWLEFGWAEVSWRDDRQYLYSYDSINNQWMWYDQYIIGPGTRLIFDVRHWGNGDWGAELWWNGQWQRVTTVNLGNHWGCITTPMVVISTGGTNRQFPFPPIKYGDGRHDFYSLGLIEAMSGRFRVWDTSIPTQENVTSEAGYYTTSFQQRYSNFEIQSHNRPPTVSTSLTPASGDRSTVFSANLSSFDPDGDTIPQQEIYWGDGSSTWGASGTHRYQSAGTYTVRGFVCDMWNECTWSAGQSVNVAFSNTAPNATLYVSPRQGMPVTTTFTASVSAWDDEADSLSYEIDWGDGTTIESSRSEHTYESPGHYEVVAVVEDEYGLTTTDIKTVSVCAVGAQACDSPSEPDPFVCEDAATCDATDTVDGAYNQLADAASSHCDSTDVHCAAVADASAAVVAAAPDRDLPPTDGPSLMTVLTANVFQAYADSAPETCPDRRPGDPNYRDVKACNPSGRERAFARRVKNLAHKSTGDGMRQLPPAVILLQEARGIDARRIAKHLNDQFPERNYRVVDPLSEGSAVKEETPDHRTLADTAILFASSILVQRNRDDELGQRYIETRYSKASEGCTVALSTFVDENDDLFHDCDKATWMRHAVASFKVRGTSRTMAVASVHLVTPNHLRDNATAVAKYEEWAAKLARELQSNDYFDGVDTYFLGGDFNVERCQNTGYPEGTDCDQQRWWRVLRFGTNFVDSVLRVNQTSAQELNHQYKDGNKRREKRIDYVWVKGFTDIVRSSHDLSCGLPGDNCDHLTNSQRYSDHRLVWSTVRLGGRT